MANEQIPAYSPASAGAGSRPHRVLEKFSALFSALVVREVLQAAFLIWLARREMAGYGQVMLALGFGQILFQFADFGLNQHLVCQSSRRPADLGGELWTVVFVKSLLLGLGGLVAWLFILTQDYGTSLSAILLLLALGVGLESLAGAFFTVCQFQERQHAESRIRMAGAVAGFGFGLVALALGLPLRIVALYKLVESAINVAGGALAVRRRLRFPVCWPGGPALLATVRGGVVFALIGLVAIIYNKANLFFLQRAGGPAAVAQYSATWQIVDGVTGVFCGLLLGKTLFPLLARLVTENFAEATRLARETTRWLVLLAFVLMIGLAVERDRFIPLIYGGGYENAVWMQRWLVIAIGLGFLNNHAAFLMISVNRPGVLLGFHLAGIAVNLVLCGVLIPAHPLAGAVAAILIAKAVVGLLTVGFCQFRFGLLQARPLAQVLAALAAGAILYRSLMGLGVRELSEGALLLPLLVLGGFWWKTRRRAPA